MPIEIREMHVSAVIKDCNEENSNRKNRDNSQSQRTQPREITERISEVFKRKKER